MRTLLACVLLAAVAAAEDLPARLASSDSDEVIAACREAAGSDDSALLAPLIRLLKHKNPAVRRAAIEALGLRKDADGQKRAAQALAQRIAPLAKDGEDKEECLAVTAALHDLAQPVALKALLDGIGWDDDQEIARARMRAAANIPTKDAVEELLHLASAGRRGGARWRTQAALEALRYATQQKVDGGVEGWRRWWSENERTYDPDAAANRRADARLKEQERETRRDERRKRKKGGDGDD